MSYPKIGATTNLKSSPKVCVRSVNDSPELIFSRWSIEAVSGGAFNVTPQYRVEENQLIIVGTFVNAKPNITPPTGWETISSLDIGSFTRIHLFAKIRKPEDPDTYSFTTSLSNSMRVIILIFKNPNTENPIGSTSSGTSSASTTLTVGSSFIDVKNKTVTILWVGRNGSGAMLTANNGFEIVVGEGVSESWRMLINETFDGYNQLKCTMTFNASRANGGIMAELNYKKWLS